MTRRSVLGVLAAAPLGFAAASTAPEAPRSDQRPKTVLVTGSSRGIGAAIARRLGREGFNVTINYIRNHDLAAEVVSDLQSLGTRAIAVRADVSQPREVVRLFDQTEEAFGGVDVVINNAGVMRLGPFATMTDEDFDHVMGVNLKGGFHVLREAARRVRDGGRILSASSSITRLRTAGYGPYAASKAALEIFSSCLAKELSGRQISVNCYAPGVVNTSLFRDVPGRTEEEIARFAARTPHGRIGEPEDIAATVAALVSGDGHWINGQTILSNGGLI